MYIGLTEADEKQNHGKQRINRKRSALQVLSPSPRSPRVYVMNLLSSVYTVVKETCLPYTRERVFLQYNIFKRKLRNVVKIHIAIWELILRSA